LGRYSLATILDANMNREHCPDLQAIHDYEVAQGNSVAHIEAPAGTACRYAVVFSQPLKIRRTPQVAEIPSGVRYWECRDPHYAIEAGYYCEQHQHSVAGPLVD